MKSFNQFLIERTINGDIYMSIGRAFISLDKIIKSLDQTSDVTNTLQILNKALEDMNRVNGEYSQNMRSGGAFGSDKITMKLGQIFYKFFNYLNDLRKQLQNPNLDTQEFSQSIGQAKQDLEQDYHSALSFVGHN